MKKAEKENMEKMEKLLETIDAHPLTAKIRQDKAAEVLATRQEAVAKIEMLRNEEALTIPKLQADRQEKELKYQKAKVALQAASDEFQAAHAALWSEANQFSREIGQQEAALFETADPAIDEAIQFFMGKMDWLRSPGRISRVGRPTKKNVFTWTKIVTEESNAPAIRTALQYCMDAVKSLEQMELCPALDLEKIAELKSRIPSIDDYQEFTGEKPMERINTDPRSLLPSDSQMEWEIGKLNEKFKKLMKK